jgi:oxalate decarboxylase
MARGDVMTADDHGAAGQAQDRASYRFAMEAQVGRVTAGGDFRIVSSQEFPISTTMTGATMTIRSGAIRALHWHPNASEWQYVIAGRTRMTIFSSHGHARTEEYGPGDIAYVPQGFGHYIEDAGEEEARLLLVFNAGLYQAIDLADWLAANPRALVAANFGVAEETLARLAAGGTIVGPGPGS